MVKLSMQPLLPLRPMQSADLDAVMAIELQAYPYPWSRLNFVDCLKHYECLVYEHDDTIIAYTVFMIVVDELSILNICVNPTYQKRGLGKALLQAIEALGIARGLTNCFLEVRPSNKAALQLYTQQGFHEIGLRKGYYPTATGRENAIVMAKALIAEDCL